MKILLVQPPPRRTEHESIVVPPLGLAYLAATVEGKGYDVKILDAFALQQSWTEFEESVKKAGADLIGIGGMTPVIDNTYRALKICRKYCKHLVLGGPHATLSKENILKEAPEVDFVVCGEGEETFAELVDGLSSKGEVSGILGTVDRNAVNPPRPLIQDLDRLPFPARHLLPNDRYNYVFAKRKTITTMFTSRGCPYQCIFCDKSVFGSQCRLRSAENVLAEIGEILDCSEDVSIVFYDDLFTLKKERVIRICEGILERGFKFDWKCEGRVDRIDGEMLGWMKKAGCSMIAYGVESGNQSGLDYLRKNTKLENAKKAFALTHKSGIGTMAYFILGIPVETYEDEIKTIEFAKELNPDYAQFSVLSPFPGTELYETAIKDGSYLETGVKNPADKDLKKPVVLSQNWDEKRLNDIMLKAHTSFYFRPRYLIKRLASIRNISDLKRFFMAGLKMLSWAQCFS